MCGRSLTALFIVIAISNTVLAIGNDGIYGHLLHKAYGIVFYAYLQPRYRGFPQYVRVNMHSKNKFILVSLKEFPEE